MFVHTASNHGPLVIGVGLVVILAAQLWPGIPIAAAIALIGYGATCVLQKTATGSRADALRHKRWRLCGSLLVYAALVGLAIGAELHLRWDAIFLADALLAMVVLIYTTHTVFQRTDSASSW